MRNAFVLAVFAAASLAPDSVLAQATTTRIETRPFYGATVTLEEGVRVFRPLPPDERVIINPNGATPLSLNFEEKRSVSHNYHYGERGDVGAPSYAGAPVGGWVGSGFDRKGHRGGGRHHPGGQFSGGKGHGGGHGGHGGGGRR